MSGSALLHAGGFGLGDVLVVGLVLQLSCKVLDRLVQALLQGYLCGRGTHHTPAGEVRDWTKMAGYNAKKWQHQGLTPAKRPNAGKACNVCG